MQERPLFVTVLAIVLGLTGLYFLVFLLATSVGGMPLELKGIFIGMNVDLARALAIAIAVTIGILSLVSAYGLWIGKSWGRWLAALIIALDILSQVGGQSMSGFLSLTIEDRTVKIDFSMLLEIVLVVAVSSLRHTQNSRNSAINHLSQGGGEQAPVKQ